MEQSNIILYDKDKGVLLQHKDSEAPNYPDKWCFFGGRIEQGETPIEAIKREA